MCYSQTSVLSYQYETLPADTRNHNVSLVILLKIKMFENRISASIKRFEGFHHLYLEARLCRHQARLGYCIIHTSGNIKGLGEFPQLFLSTVRVGVCVYHASL